MVPICCSGPARVFLALTQYRLGQTHEAEQTLTAAEQLLAPILKNRAEDWRFGWNADLCLVALEEAHQILHRGGTAQLVRDFGPRT